MPSADESRLYEKLDDKLDNMIRSLADIKEWMAKADNVLENHANNSRENGRRIGQIEQDMNVLKQDRLRAEGAEADRVKRGEKSLAERTTAIETTIKSYEQQAEGAGKVVRWLQAIGLIGGGGALGALAKHYLGK